MSPPAAASEDSHKAGAQQARASVGSSVWLKPERFEASDFSPDLCVSDLRRYVPLPTVKAELQTYLVHLKNKLVEAINDDYSDYVGLSSKLTGLDGAVVRMRQPLLDIQSKLTSVQNAIQAELQALQQGLQRRQDAAAARATLELMQEVAASTGKVEKLLEEVAATAAQQQGNEGQQQVLPAATSTDGSDGATAAAGGDGELTSRCRLLVRAAGEASRLLFLVERGKDLAFVRSLDRRVNGCRMNLDRQLQAALLAALAASDWAAAANCLRGYLEISERGRGEEGLRAGLVGPLVRQVVAEVRQQQLAAAGGAAGGAGGLSAVVAGVLAQLQASAGPLVTQLLAPGSGMSGIDLLGAVLLGELSQAVADGMPGVFSPGNPAAFQAAYLAGQQLLAKLEELATSRAAVERLRASAAAAGWAKRWNLPVYFSLVYQDIAGTFEAVAKLPQLQPAADAGLTAPLPSGFPQLQLAVSSCLWGCLQRAVAPEVFLVQLADRFSRLIAQLLARYDSWALVAGPYVQQLRGLMSSLPEEVVAKLTGMLQEMAADIGRHGQQVLLLVGGDVVERCMAMVRQLKGITATYRMTAKGPPVRHSHYVVGVLQPLRQLLDSAGPVQRLPDNLKLLLSRDVIDNINIRYNSLAEELLTTVKKTESSLKRLKKTRPGEGPDAAVATAAGGPMSDSDKICMQLFLDVEEHGRQIRNFGLQAQQLESYRQLLAAVTPADKQQSQQPGQQNGP
eukprot:gene12760-12889_t